MESSDIIVEVKDLTAGYDNNIVIENINFCVTRGEIFVILGRSGCGKTTLLKQMIGLTQPMSGEILINGKSIVNAVGEDKRKLVRGFGVLYQSGALFGSLSVEQNITILLEEYTDLSLKSRQEVVKEKLELVGLSGIENYLPNELSGGMKKRVALARAMALDPPLLFFDEPSAGLDPVTSANLDKLILDIREKTGTTMVIVTHELDSIYAVSDRIIMLDDRCKGIIATGRVTDLKDNNKDPWVQEFINRAGMGRESFTNN